MSSMTLILSIFAVVVMVAYTEANSCPLPSKVYGCSPKCVQDYECTHGKKCCSNACNAKSCAEPVAGGQGGSNKYSQSSGAGIYCDNVKCNAYEVCKLDPSTKRMKCSRA